MTLPEESRAATRAKPDPPLATSAAEAYAGISPLIAAKMVRVEGELKSWLVSDVEVVSRLGGWVAASGGKRLRPALLLLSSGLVGYRGELDVLFGAVFEFIHTATLVHDDIIDEADVRRGRASLNRKWGNDLSVLMGDHLYLKAMKMALRAQDLRILELLADVTLRMIEGELIQTHVNGRLDLTEAQYLDIVERKTALLFSACCRVPVMLAKRGEAEERALAAYGRDLGMAFQVVDDLLDLTSEEEKLGKPVGWDLRKGELTLPLIHLLRLGTARHRDLVAGVLSEGPLTPANRKRIVEALAETGALRSSREVAAEWARRALGHLDGFPAGPFHSALARVPEFVVGRDH